jgi:hypothetical protein
MRLLLHGRVLFRQTLLPGMEAERDDRIKLHALS